MRDERKREEELPLQLWCGFLAVEEVEINGGGCGCESVNGCGCEREEEIMGVVVVDRFGYFEFVKIWGCARFTNDILSLFKFGWELCLLLLVWLRD